MDNDLAVPEQKTAIPSVPRISRILLWWINIHLVHGPFHSCAREIWGRVAPSPLFRFVLRYISFMSHTIPTGFLRKRMTLSTNSDCILGPAWNTLIRDTPECLAEQSNTIRTLVVVLSILTIGKWGTYHDSGSLLATTFSSSLFLGKR